MKKTTNETQQRRTLCALRIALAILIGLFIIISTKIALKATSNMVAEQTICSFSPIVGETGRKSVKLKKVNIPQPEPELPYTDEELYWTARLINSEQGTEYPDERFTNMLQIYAGKVMLNRLEQGVDYANNIYEEVHSHAYDRSGPSWDKEITPRAWKNAELLLKGEQYWEILDIPKMPDSVIYQAEFTQGSGVWQKLGNTYFCYK